MSSLSAAAISHGLPTLKGGLPHRYLQNCKNPQELLDRLHGQVTWTELEPYMDWFSECKDLQKRKAGRTWEQWRDEQPVRQHWVEHKDEKIDFLQKMKAYLATDVNLLWELVQKEGAQKAEAYQCDIRQKCTLGSIEFAEADEGRRPCITATCEPRRVLWTTECV